MLEEARTVFWLTPFTIRVLPLMSTNGNTHKCKAYGKIGGRAHVAIECLLPSIEWGSPLALLKPEGLCDSCCGTPPEGNKGVMPVVCCIDVVTQRVLTFDSQWQIYHQEQLVQSCIYMQKVLAARREAKTREMAHGYDGAAAANCTSGKTICPRRYSRRDKWCGPSAPAPSPITTPSSPKGHQETQSFGV